MRPILVQSTMLSFVKSYSAPLGLRASGDIRASVHAIQVAIAEVGPSWADSSNRCFAWGN